MIAQYGPRAAEILNESHCKIEDQLVRLTQHAQELQAFGVQSVMTINALAPHIERYGNMENLLTDSNRLAQYTVDYFTHVDPVPDRPQPESASASLVRPDFPSIPMPNTPGGVRLADVRPEQRWMVADQMERSGLLQGKPLIVGQQ